MPKPPARSRSTGCGDARWSAWWRGGSARRRLSKGRASQGGFVDEVRIFITAGAGGSGSAAFHHEPYKPKGGPDGGDGADGGNIILRADRSVGTLLELRDHPHVKAGDGGGGRSKRRHGARG
ncbi:MAG: hypothetical protein ACR2MC_10310, partial [Actinomycetota bacterium]